MRVAILGIGNLLNGDDAAGVLALRSLERSFRRKLLGQAQEKQHHYQWGNIQVLVVETGTTPESFTGPLRRFAPDCIVMIDAAEMSKPAGTVQVVDWGDAVGWSGATHALPPTVLAEYLHAALGCRLILVGIQPAQLDFDAGVSAAVKIGIRKAARTIQQMLASGACSPNGLPPKV